MATADHAKQTSRTNRGTSKARSSGSSGSSNQRRTAEQQAPVYRITLPVDRWTRPPRRPPRLWSGRR